MGKTRKRRTRRDRQQRTARWVLPAIILAAVVITAGLIWLSGRASNSSGQAVMVPTDVARPYADGKALGPADAPVLVEEYSDFQ